jgi:hypothetical protein
VHIARPQQGADVGFVGLGGHGVAQEDHAVHLAHGQACAYLKVAAQRAAEQAFHGQAHLGLKPPAGGAGGHEGVLAKQGR